MSETTTSKDDKKKPLKLNRPGRLELRKTVQTGQVRQSFSHGRSKAVTVEVKRKRTFAGLDNIAATTARNPSTSSDGSPNANVRSQSLVVEINPHAIVDCQVAICRCAGHIPVLGIP